MTNSSLQRRIAKLVEARRQRQEDRELQGDPKQQVLKRLAHLAEQTYGDEAFGSSTELPTLEEVETELQWRIVEMKRAQRQREEEEGYQKTVRIVKGKKGLKRLQDKLAAAAQDPLYTRPLPPHQSPAKFEHYSVAELIALSWAIKAQNSAQAQG